MKLAGLGDPVVSARLARNWHWWLLAVLVIPAIWHVVDFPEDRDPEFPRIERPTFSKLPPPAYRLAEPGDTIDRVGLYLSAAALALAVLGRTSRNSPPWNWAIGLSVAAFWYAASPGPTFDGWHGLGWRTMFDPSAPTWLRAALGSVAVVGCGSLLASVVLRRERLPEFLADARASGVRGLLAASAVLIALRQVEWPGVEPVGYWPRWCFVWGMAAFDLAMIRAMIAQSAPSSRRMPLRSLGAAAGWAILVVVGIQITWYHRPLARLRTVVPGKIFLSGMPTYRGLEVAHARHRFKTIINVFAEDTPQRSPLLPDELRFVEEHGIRYLNAPASQVRSDEFLDETLRLAQDPEAWPILLHCHGCMDRSPAWMGIYRFLVQGRPLDEIFREIEGHRGYRPKASVTLLFNRVLLARDRERYLADPVGRFMLETAKGTIDPYYELVRRELEGRKSRTR
ncbi:MAG: protein tyrosine phosphatase [Isosphaeraceae bacterium]|nr:protein tyrosine phosphatase [Isosphaeraceae bacterium]